MAKRTAATVSEGLRSASDDTLTAINELGKATVAAERAKNEMDAADAVFKEKAAAFNEAHRKAVQLADQVQRQTHGLFSDDTDSRVRVSP